MALKPSITAAEHGALDPALQGLYKAGSGGAFVLDVEGIDNVAALPNAFAATKKEREDARKRAAELEEKLKRYDGIEDADEARKLIEEARKHAEKKLLDAGQVDELFAQRTDRMVKAHQAELSARDKRIAELEGSSKELTGKLRSALIDNTISVKAPGFKVRDTAIEDVLKSARDGRAGVPKWQIGDDGKPQAINEDGSPVFGADGRTPLTIDEWYGVLAERASHLFMPSEGADAQGGGKGHTTIGNQIVISRADAQDFGRYKAIRAEAEKAGKTVVVKD